MKKYQVHVGYTLPVETMIEVEAVDELDAKLAAINQAVEGVYDRETGLAKTNSPFKILSISEITPEPAAA